MCLGFVCGLVVLAHASAASVTPEYVVAHNSKSMCNCTMTALWTNWHSRQSRLEPLCQITSVELLQGFRRGCRLCSGPTSLKRTLLRARSQHTVACTVLTLYCEAGMPRTGRQLSKQTAAAFATALERSEQSSNSSITREPRKVPSLKIPRRPLALPCTIMLRARRTCLSGSRRQVLLDARPG